MKLPAIISPAYGKSIKVLVFSSNKTEDNAAHLQGMHKGKYVNYIVDESSINITREYLQNTWGEVESKEHAEFIIELAESHGFKLWMPSDGLDRVTHFIVFDGELMMHAHDCQRAIERHKLKQITIPLPPKSKEWSPEVGDEVVAVHPCNKLEGRLLALTKEYAIISQSHGEQHLHLSSWSFEKPKSAQELKIEELQTKLCENNAVDSYILACDIVMGNIEGLSYE